MKNNVTLIGMPSAGKSTVGVLLAKRLGYSFIDVDLLIQEQEGKRLREIIEEQGLDGFLDVENRVNAGVEAEQAVIAPGGSVIYGKEAMEHLKSIGLVVYLKITYDELVKRVGDVKDRGVALKDGMTLLDLYHERISYFEKYADITIDEEGKELGAVVDELREIRVGEIGDDHPQHFRRTAFQGPGDQVRMISELLSRLSDPELGGLRHFLRAAVEDIAHRGGRHSRQPGHIAPSDPGWPAIA